jgi:hypothetical protein
VDHGLVLTGGAPGEPASVHRLRALRRGSRRPSLGVRAERIYTAVLVGAIGLAVVWGAIGEAVRTVVQPESWAAWGPPLLLAAVVAALRLGVWQGPVVFSAADVAHLLRAPVRRAALVRPLLVRALGAGAVAGAALGGLGVGMSLGAGDRPGAARAAGAVVAAGLLGAGAVAGSWLVESSARLAGDVRRASPALWALIAALGACSAAGGTARAVELASGPWGWAVAVLSASAGAAAAALAGTALVAAAAVAMAWGRAGAGTVEGFGLRARARAGIVASAASADYRTMARSRRAAARGVAGGARGRARRAGGRLARPPRPALAVPWRDVVALSREPARTAAALALGAASVAAAALHPDRGAWVAAAAVGAYGAALALLEPARMELDAPDRAALLLGRPAARAVLAHAALPGALLVAVSLPAVGVVAAAGGASPAAAAGALLAAVPGWALLVLCGAGSARRGGRVPSKVVLAAITDPSGGAVTVASWLLAWPVIAIGATCAAVLPAARAATGGPLQAAVVLAVAALVVRAWLAFSPAPG